LKLLIQQPVTDHVLDIVRHHGEHRGREENTKVRVAQRGERHSFNRCGCALGGGYGLGALGQFSSGECEWISKPIVEPRTVTNLPGLCKPSDELTVGTLPRRIDRWWKADRPSRQAASNRPFAEVGSSAWLQCMTGMYAD
jgi:hypothetical protein